ncbi:expressed unknown protein [Seminavis robusta]|uniref:V-SNARE coiled-coil homology domain-containing protein n=1 Tax=Seminavis robusta TaxID=568900 RepID=A0A9N8E3N3_9STRA|nr:expressed unknown protein [Seminavis robusta]|eukprot:Sro492_g153760.1 n/a (291) ;mRNA; f:12981-13961
MKKEERVRYIAAIRQPHHLRQTVESHSSCLEDVEANQVTKFAGYKLKGINKVQNFYSHFSNHMGAWHVKGINGVTYIVLTTQGYPGDVAVECLDEFSDSYERVSKSWLSKRREKARSTCCQAVFDKYTSVQVESAPWFLMNQVDGESRREYSKSVKNLFSQIDKLEKKINDNIMKELDNIESAERLQELSEDCLEKAQVFRKKAHKVKMKSRWKSRAFVATGVTACAAVGGVVGFLAGGPSGALILTSMSVAEAQAIEASVAALVFGAGFYAAQSKVENWSWNQPIIVLK